MRYYIVNRLIQFFFLLIGISFISFCLMHLAPGGPESRYIDQINISPAALEEIREHYGLNQPIPIQYAKWLWNLAHADLGRSYITLRPVTDSILEVLPNTLLLLGLGSLLGLVGIPLGIFLAYQRERWPDNLFRIVAGFVRAIPHWWLGLLILMVAATFSNTTGITLIPLPGYNPRADKFWYPLWQLLLPVILIGLGDCFYYSRLTRSLVLDVLRQDYVRTANAKGLSTGQVSFRHVLRNAILPLLTVIVDLLPGIWGGAIIFENIFAISGMGRLSYQALQASDYPLVAGCLVIGAVLSMSACLIADILCFILDPRIAYA